MKISIYQKGFTLFELLVILGILMILIAIALPSLRTFQQNYDLENSTEGIINSLRLAQAQTVASEGESQYGVYFNAIADPQEYTVFKGESYALRDISSDVIHKLPKSVLISAIDLWGTNEVVFERLTGNASSSPSFGKISIELADNASKTEDIYIGSSGLVKSGTPPLISDIGRIVDSRHLHFDYSRNIATDTEKIILDFSGVPPFEIPIASNLVDGQIYWEGDVDVGVGGQIQHLKIHTHRLNNFQTQFCVHRDRRYNDKALTVFLSGDSDSLISYTDDGQESRGSSIYLSADPQKQ
ncbi:MAG: prepilin-type N-terminal cleavage/methylation domain-containing protein [Parcubacteria group bacterium]